MGIACYFFFSKKVNVYYYYYYKIVVTYFFYKDRTQIKGVYVSLINQSFIFIGIIVGISAFFPLFFPVAVTILWLLGYFKDRTENNWIDVTKKQEYIKSSSIWQEKRKERLAIDNHKCYSCNSSNRLEVHHITYKNLYKENMADLICVCRSCHNKIHKEYGYKYSTLFPPLRIYGKLDI